MIFEYAYLARNVHFFIGRIFALPSMFADVYCANLFSLILVQMRENQRDTYFDGDKYIKLAPWISDLMNSKEFTLIR